MKINEVPQDHGIIEGHGQEICYAVNEQGQYTLAPSLGWDVKNVVNDQAWDLIFKEIQKAHTKVINNKLSPLAFHLTRNQMDVKLLAQYVSMARWRVRCHLNPRLFNRLSESKLQAYADVFNISIEELKTVPENISIETITNKSK